MVQKLTAEQWIEHVQANAKPRRNEYPAMMAQMRAEIAKLTTEQLINELPLMPDNQVGYDVHCAICMEAAARLRRCLDEHQG